MRETLIRCVRCNRPICSDCMRPASVGFQCPDDVKLGRATQRPLRTSVGAVRRGNRPYVTGVLVALNVAVYVITAVQSVYGFNRPSRSALFEQWQMLPAAVGTSGQYYRLLTATFLHANVLHIVTNMLALIIIGPYLERLLGWWRYLSVYLLGALGGSVAIYLFGARFGPVVGASGAIFGLFAAALVFVRELNLDPQWLVATIVLNLVVTFSVPDVSRLGHVGGFVCGGLAALAIAGNPRKRRWLPIRVASGRLVRHRRRAADRGDWRKPSPFDVLAPGAGHYSGARTTAPPPGRHADPHRAPIGSARQARRGRRSRAFRSRARAGAARPGGPCPPPATHTRPGAPACAPVVRPGRRTAAARTPNRRFRMRRARWRRHQPAVDPRASVVAMAAPAATRVSASHRTASARFGPNWWAVTGFPQACPQLGMKLQSCNPSGPRS